MRWARRTHPTVTDGGRSRAPINSSGAHSVELRLASDSGLAEGYGPELMRPVELAR